MKNFFHAGVPLWITILILATVSATFIVVFIEFRNTIYNAEFTLPTNTQLGLTYSYGSWPALDNADYYSQVLDQFVVQKATFINANLSTMTLRFYKDGAVLREMPILAKGKPGSWWETPAGLYKVTDKIQSDFSSFAHVYSPWALAFQGNFLIHGWPYYPDGTPVPAGYSGGCIRLSTNDAKALYALVPVGTPILVSSADFMADDFHEQMQTPRISPESFLAADLKSNFVFAEKNPDKKLPIASLTKLMTALVAVEYVNIENTITITPDMIVKTSIPRLKVGQELSLYDLLQPLLKESSNEAAVAISHFLGPNYFVRLMNHKAAAIGMTNTRFADSSGSDWNDVSTAHDLFMLAQYLYNNRSFILKMTTKDTDSTVYGPVFFTNLQNVNVFANDLSFVGGKVGMNGGASGTILSVFMEPFARSVVASTTDNNSSTVTDRAAGAVTSTIQRPMAFVILGSDDYTQDGRDLLAWIRDVYQ